MKHLAGIYSENQLTESSNLKLHVSQLYNLFCVSLMTLHVDTDVCKIAVDSGTPEFYVVVCSGFVTSYMMHVASMVLRALNPKCFIGLSSIFLEHVALVTEVYNMTL